MTVSAEIRELIQRRRLVAHPEGGWYRETGRADRRVATPFGERPESTTIEFLLATGQVSRLHRLRQDECWAHLEGPGLALHLFPPDQAPRVCRLAAGAVPVTVPAGVWMGAESPGGWALVTCECRPGFEYVDLEFAARAALIAAWPEHAAIIRRLTP